MACVNGALGMQVTDQLLAGRYEPTSDELEQVRHCSLSAAPGLDSGAAGETGANRVEIQSAFACVSAALGSGEAWGLGSRMLSGGELDMVADCPMPTHDQWCIFDFVGKTMLDNLVTGRYQATANDASMIQHCALAYGSTWSSWLGSEPFFVDAPSDSDQAFGDTAPDQDWDYPDDDQGQTDEATQSGPPCLRGDHGDALGPECNVPLPTLGPGVTRGDANLEGTLLYGANLRGADLRGADRSTDLKGAEADEYTIWPEGFDPVAAGVIFD
jgi:hypothetical protein